jgi:hypothetical protein
LIGLALLAGCGGVTAASADGGITGAGDAPVEQPAVTVEGGCNQLAQALCDAIKGCAPILIEILYGDEGTCVARSALSCKTDQGVPNITRTPADLVTCAQAVPASSCPDLLAGIYPDACAPKPGTIDNGAACGSNLQCKSTYCNKTDACGVCSPRQAAGGACATNDGCAKGLVCANMACVAPASLGQPCTLPAQPCRGDLYCTSAKTSGVCATKIGPGGPCVDNPGDACDFSKAAVCNTLANPNVCVAITVAKPGSMCSLASKTGCVGGIAPCSNVLLGGICASPAQDGEACGGNAVCIPPATCVNKICRLPSAPECH